MRGLIKLLQSRIREYQDRCGPPTTQDLRARGVTKSQVLRYMKQRDWYCSTPDTGNARREPGQHRPPAWLHDEHGEIIPEYADVMIQDLAKCEGRSPWAVLDSCDAGRELYDAKTGELIGREAYGEIEHV